MEYTRLEGRLQWRAAFFALSDKWGVMASDPGDGKS
jgi:hypothetical protein